MSKETNDIRVDLYGNWRVYQSTGPEGFSMLGTVTVGEKTEALALTAEGMYVRISGNVYTELPQDEVKRAIAAARS